MWRSQLDALSPHFRCIAPALWGHGASDTLDERRAYALESLTDDMEAFVDALDLKEFSIIGLSVGGMWGARLAHRFPERVHKLVLMGTDVGLEPPESQQRFLGMLSMVEEAGALPPPLVEACLPFFFCDKTLKTAPHVVEAFRQSLLHWDAEKVSGVISLGQGIFTREDFLPQLGSIRCPSRVIVGEQDRSRPPAEAAVLAKTLPHARLEVVKNAGHISAVEQPEIVTGLLKTFLQS